MGEKPNTDLLIRMLYIGFSPMRAPNSAECERSGNFLYLIFEDFFLRGFNDASLKHASNQPTLRVTIFFAVLSIALYVLAVEQNVFSETG